MKTRWIFLTAFLALTLAGCGQNNDRTPMEPKSPPGNPPPTASVPVEVTPLSTPQPDSPPQAGTTPQANPSDPELQKLIQTATEDLAKRFSIAPDQIQLQEALEMTWPDSSLGCPNPSSMYMQVLTPGYLIRLQTPGGMFEYHTDKRGAVVYCENPSPLPLDSLPKE